MSNGSGSTSRYKPKAFKPMSAEELRWFEEMIRLQANAGLVDKPRGKKKDKK